MLAATLGLAALSGCNDGQSPPSAGSIGFAEGSSVAVTAGSVREVELVLQSSTGVSGQRVAVASSDTAVAEVSPDSCTLSSSSAASGKCTVKVHGKSNGTATVRAFASGYADAALTASVASSIAYGQLAVADDSGSFVSTTPVKVDFRALGSTPYQKKLKAKISGSSGITDATSALINFSSAAPRVAFDPPQCQVTSASPECETTVTLPSATVTSIAVQVVGAVTVDHTYSSITVTANPNTTPSYGRIVVSTQSGNNVPNGMKAPLFVNWIDPGGIVDTVSVTLTIAGTGVSFYSYAAGNNTTITTSTTRTCALSYTGDKKTDVLNCGLGLLGSATSGTVVVNATATGTSGHVYDIAALTLGAVAQAATRRSVTFTNNSSSDIFVGITGGAAAAYLDPTTPAAPPGATTANAKPGAGSLCGPSNPQAACPIGTTCIQGGSAPNTSATKSPFYCYYDQSSPSNGYKLAAGTGATTVLEISRSSLSPNGVIWSGNFYARTGCDASGNCENATCVGAAGGLACGPGTGPSPGVNTLAEVTFQAYPSTDFYDVSIINGVNFATQFGPTNVAISPTNGYSCGTAGSTTTQNGGYVSGSTSTAGLPAASWTFAPTTASFPAGAIVTGDPSSYFRVVSPAPAATPPAPQLCTEDKGCTSAPNTTCGYAIGDIATGSFSFDAGKRVCGRAIAWITADSIWGLNASKTNTAPFSFDTVPSGGSVSVGDLQLCINKTYSTYASNGTATSTPAFPVQPIALACGGVMWGATESPGPQQNPAMNVGLEITPPAKPVQTANQNWLTYVLPTIKWLKQACPTCYTYPFDDMTSTFTCADTSRNTSTTYGVTFSDAP